MNADEIRSLQAPLKERYRERPDTALVTLRAEGRIGEGVTCKIETGKGLVEAGLHPGTGGDGLAACSGDMLLQALVACAGVTLGAVATALNIRLRDAVIRAEGDLDFRGTLGVSKEVPVGFEQIRLHFDLDTAWFIRRFVIRPRSTLCVALRHDKFSAPQTLYANVHRYSRGSRDERRRRREGARIRSRSAAEVRC